VFLNSNKARNNVTFDYTMDDINFEFNALETVGDADTGDFYIDDNADKQWRQLETIVNKEFLKFTTG